MDSFSPLSNPTTVTKKEYRNLVKNCYIYENFAAFTGKIRESHMNKLK